MAQPAIDVFDSEPNGACSREPLKIKSSTPFIVSNSVMKQHTRQNENETT